jgi:hypothetical protein
VARHEAQRALVVSDEDGANRRVEVRGQKRQRAARHFFDRRRALSALGER